MNFAPVLIGLAGLAFAAPGVSAQAVYRCGNEYTRVPCPDGKTVDIDNHASSVQRAAEAKEFAAREKRLGDDMARDRRARDASVRPAQAGSLSPPPRASADQPRAASATLKPKKKAKAKIRVVDEKDFIATVPKARPR